jgi:monoterpene epsilon-lactone hydrolase
MIIRLGQILKPIMRDFGRSELTFRRDRFIVDHIFPRIQRMGDFPGVFRSSIKLPNCTADVFHPVNHNPGRYILFNHGGAFCFALKPSYIRTASMIADLTKSLVVLPDYRLAPDCPYPAAIDDCRDALHWFESQGITRKDIVLVGDSAGGNIALNLAQEAVEVGSLVLISPWLDLSCSSAEWDLNISDHFVHKTPAKRAAWLYVNGNKDWTYGESNPQAVAEFDSMVKDPSVSPIYGDMTFSSTSPVLIQVSGSERMLGDALMLWHRLSSERIVIDSNAETAVRRWSSGGHKLSVWPNEPHVWQILKPGGKTGRAALQEICDHVCTSYHVS